MFNCKSKKNPNENELDKTENEEMVITSCINIAEKQLYSLVSELVELNLNYNIKFNEITNKINKIKLLKENKDVYELDSVRKNTHINIYEQVDNNYNRTRGISAPPLLSSSISNVKISSI
jgi:hypothetical protein